MQPIKPLIECAVEGCTQTVEVERLSTDAVDEVGWLWAMDVQYGVFRVFCPDHERSRELYLDPDPKLGEPALKKKKGFF